ncbi:MAG: ATP-binding protein [Deltaproteobacteria bacterium]|nr:ATP-binding protein [Deltaproteobacteria bacterium]
MWNKISLRTRIYLLLVLLVCITAFGGMIMVWYTYRMQGLLSGIVEQNMAAFQSAVALETALANQKGFVSYYFLDGDPDWLRQLGEYRQIFRQQLEEARSLVESSGELQAVERIASEYEDYIRLKDKVIGYYKSGDREVGGKLHDEVRKRFFNILDRCERYKALNMEKMAALMAESHGQARQLRIIAVSAIVVVLFLGLLLAFILVHHILGPLRRLALVTKRAEEMDGRWGDEVKALSRSVHGLMKDVDHTHLELAKSRETLLQAEKMALVGKLAAGMAHGIRNPLTSVKMRLFSLGRSLNLSDDQQDDFEVISEEIRHVDTIVENFLEFSRPPKLTMQPISPSTVVDSVHQLLRHRLQSYEVVLEIEREAPLPEIQADPEQLKEALVNIVENACESMPGGGSISIHETMDPGKAVVIRITDNGPGISDSVLARIFEPFFTTKEEGTGLGLSIAFRIVEEHGGELDVRSKEGRGATFTITLPINQA